MNMNKIGLLNVNECPPEIVYPYTSVNLCVTIGVQLSFSRLALQVLPTLVLETSSGK